MFYLGHTEGFSLDEASQVALRIVLGDEGGARIYRGFAENTHTHIHTPNR